MLLVGRTYRARLVGDVHVAELGDVELIVGEAAAAAADARALLWVGVRVVQSVRVPETVQTQVVRQSARVTHRDEVQHDLQSVRSYVVDLR